MEAQSFKTNLFLFCWVLWPIFRDVMLLCILFFLVGNEMASIMRDYTRLCFMMLLLVDGYAESAIMSAIDVIEIKGIT